MKTILFIFLALIFTSAAYSQSGKWSTVTYNYSNGPVSPEYQYKFTININETGDSKLIYTNNSGTKEYDFRTGEKGMKHLDKALKRSKVFTIRADKMKSDRTLIGGQSRTLDITLWQSPDLDSKPEVIQVPSQVKEEYLCNLNKVYDTIESLVPSSVWSKATVQ